MAFSEDFCVAPNAKTVSDKLIICRLHTVPYRSKLLVIQIAGKRNRLEWLGVFLVVYKRKSSNFNVYCNATLAFIHLNDKQKTFIVHIHAKQQ